MATRSRVRAKLSADEFGKLLANIITALKEIEALSRELRSKKAKEIKDTKGRSFTSKSLTAARNEQYKAIKDLKNYYRAGSKRAPVDREMVNGGFRLPLQVNDSIFGFFNEADLGNIRFKNGNGQLVESGPLKTKLTLLGDRISTRSILTPLFTLYIKRHTLSRLSNANRGKSDQEMQGQLLGADPLMKKWFATTFTELVGKSNQKLQAMGVSDMTPKPELTAKGKRRKFYKDNDRTKPIWNDFYHVFNPDNFSYGNVQSIIALNTDKRADGKFSKEVAALYSNALRANKVNGEFRADLAATGEPHLNIATGIQSQIADVDQRNWLLRRAQLDDEHILVSAVLSSYATEKKKAKSRKTKA